MGNGLKIAASILALLTIMALCEEAFTNHRYSRRQKITVIIMGVVVGALIIGAIWI